MIGDLSTTLQRESVGLSLQDLAQLELRNETGSDSITTEMLKAGGEGTVC